MSTANRDGEGAGCVHRRVANDRQRAMFFKPWGAAEGPGQGCDHSVRALGKMMLAAMCRLLQEWRRGNGGERDFQN